MQVIKTIGNWSLFDNYIISYKPEERDYWIEPDRIKTAADYREWLKHLQYKTWFDAIEEGDFEGIVYHSFKVQGFQEECRNLYNY